MGKISRTKQRKTRSRKETRAMMRKYYTVTKTDIVHHKDLNPFNNNYDNLEIMDKWEHTELHSKLRRDIQIRKDHFAIEIGLLIYWAGITENEALERVEKNLEKAKVSQVLN